ISRACRSRSWRSSSARLQRRASAAAALEGKLMNSKDVIVTYRAVLNALNQGDQEATLEGAVTHGTEQRVLNEISQDPDITPAEAAEMLATLSDALSALQAAEQDPDVFTALPHEMASHLQSYVATQAAEKGKAVPLPTGGLEAQFDDHDIPRWVGTFLL